jgi:predicted acyl esterase
MRTPYGRASDRRARLSVEFARRGYVAISQDCRGTGDSEPDVWEYYVHEPEDGVDLVEWVTRQAWFNGYLYSCGGSYEGATQWCMAAHPRMSAIAPEVTGLGITRESMRRYMFVNGYPRSVGRGSNRLPVPYTEIERLIESETMAGGYFNEPLNTPLPESLSERHPEFRGQSLSRVKQRLWANYCSLPPAERAAFLKQLMGAKEFSYVQMCSLTTVFDSLIPYGYHSIPSVGAAELFERFHAPALMLTGWYDWNLGDQLPSWVEFRRRARPEVASRSRLVIAPSAHSSPGYHEDSKDHAELRHDHRANIDVLLRWYEAVREGTTDAWPTVTFYLMGANEWLTASDWPVPEAREMPLYLGSGGVLSSEAPPPGAPPDRYTYDPSDPTPTVGGSILSYLYVPGSADVRAVQNRPDVLTYTTDVLLRDLDVVGPLRMILYASSSAVDTDFVVRLSDIFPDGRAIQLQNGALRARYRDLQGAPQLLEPNQIYCFEIDMWASANRFKAGHQLRVDISSADFPRFDRNSNRGGDPGPPVPATQAVYCDAEHPSHLLLSVLFR